MSKNMKFNNILRTVILEQSRMDILVNKLTKAEKGKKPLLKPAELFALVITDPQTKVKEGVTTDNFDGDFSVVKKVGPYAQWLIKQYLTLAPKYNDGTPVDPENRDFIPMKAEKQRLFWEDLFKLPDLIRKWDKFKNRVPIEQRDINKLSIEQVEDLMSQFKLEKTKGTKDEKKQAAKTFEYPGSDVIYRGSDWTVVKISDTGELGRNAACFFGGNMLHPEKGETGWCTSSPGYSRWFNHYISKGPLYVILPNTSEKFGEVSGLPTERFQFHFQENQFMDKRDRRVELVQLMNGPMKELKPLFKKEFQKNLANFRGETKELQIEYPRDSVSEYVAIYGWDDLFKNLDPDITSIDFTNNSKEELNLKFPPQLSNLKNLQTFFVENAISEVPEQLKDLKNLEFISFPNNKRLKKLPEWLADLPNLTALSAKGTDPNLEIPDRLKEKLTPWGGPVWFVHND